MPRYAILTPVKRGGTVHRDSIVLGEQDAAQLLASGAIELREPADEHPPESAPATGPQAQAAGAGANAPGQMTPAAARVTDNNKKPRRSRRAAAKAGG